MLIFFFLYGTAYYKVRMGMGRHPLVYAAYSYDDERNLPEICGQTYRNITSDQWSWLHEHIGCDVTYSTNGWEAFGDLGGILNCINHGVQIKPYSPDPPYDLPSWEPREV